MKRRCIMNMVVVVMAATMMCGDLSDAAVSRKGETEQEYVVLLEEDANHQRALSKVVEYGKVVEEIAKNQEQDAIVAELTKIEAEKIEQSREIALVEKNISFDVSGEEKEIQAIQDVVDSRWNIKMVHGKSYGYCKYEFWHGKVFRDSGKIYTEC